MAWRLLLMILLVLSPLMGRAAAGGQPLQITSVKARFLQEKQVPILAHPLRSEGRFVFQAPTSLRWEYTRPLHSVLLLHQGRIRSFIERDGHLEEKSHPGPGSMEVVLEQISDWLKGRFADNNLFRVDRSHDGLVILRPRDTTMQAIISRIELRPGARPGLIDTVTIFEGSDAWTRLTFSQAELNQPVAAGCFTKP